MNHETMHLHYNARINNNLKKNLVNFECDVKKCKIRVSIKKQNIDITNYICINHPVIKNQDKSTN